MRRPVFADPKTDFTFHRIFGTDEHKGVLIGFLNDILALEGEYERRMLSLAKKERQKDGLAHTIGDICELLSIELTVKRNAESSKLDVQCFEALRDRIRRTKAWD